MAIDRGRGVAQGFGDDSYWGEFGEFMEGPKPGCSTAESGTEPSVEGRGPEVSPWRAAAEHPVAIEVRGCLVVGGGGRQFAPGLIERRCKCDFDSSEGDGDEFLCHGDVVPGQLDDVGDLLAEDQNEDGCCAVLGFMSVVWLSLSTSSV